MEIEITDVKISLSLNHKDVAGWADITICNSILLKEIRIDKKKDGELSVDVSFSCCDYLAYEIIDKKTEEELSKIIISEYIKAANKKGSDGNK